MIMTILIVIIIMMYNVILYGSGAPYIPHPVGFIHGGEFVPASKSIVCFLFLPKVEVYWTH